MISKVSTKDLTTVVWISHGSNTYGCSSLPLMCDGRVEVEPHNAPLDLDDIRRLSQKRSHPDKGFRFERQDMEMLARVVAQIDYLDALPSATFRDFVDHSTLTVQASLAEVLASLDCDPEQTSSFAIKLADGSALRDVVSSTHLGFALVLKGDGFSVRVLLNNRYVWVSYDTRILKSQYNPKWLFERSDLGDLNAQSKHPYKTATD